MTSCAITTPSQAYNAASEMARKIRSVSVSVDWCHICGLPILDCIVSQTHNLFGTVDHVIPLSRGGTNNLANRRAAHRLCNRLKANKPLSEVNRVGLQGAIKLLMNQVGLVCSHQMLAKARQRIGAPVNTNHGKGAKARLPYSLQSWENEGGSVVDRISKRGRIEA